MSSAAPASSASSSSNLREEFWVFTVAALTKDLPPPRLDFLFDGLRLFSLQADEDNGDLLLLDFEDAAEKACKSKRGFKVRVPDDDSPATTGLVFAKVFPGQIESIDAAIDLVCQYFTEKSSWYQSVYGVAFEYCEKTKESVDSDAESAGDTDAAERILAESSALEVVLMRAVAHHQGCSYTVDRRYATVLKDRGNSVFTFMRKSDWVIEMEKLGHATLTLMRTLNHCFKDSISPIPLEDA